MVISKQACWMLNLNSFLKTYFSHKCRSRSQKLTFFVFGQKDRNYYEFYEGFQLFSGGVVLKTKLLDASQTLIHIMRLAHRHKKVRLEIMCATQHREY